jgi:hypothetical protein
MKQALSGVRVLDFTQVMALWSALRVMRRVQDSSPQRLSARAGSQS